MTFTYNGTRMPAKGVMPPPSSLMGDMSRSRFWLLVFSRILAGSGVTLCGLFLAFAGNLLDSLFCVVVVAVQSFLLELVVEWLGRKRRKKMQMLGCRPVYARIHPVRHWLLLFCAIEVVCILIVCVIAVGFVSR